MKTNIQRITPFLWFDSQAEEALRFYTSIFKNSKIGTITRYGKEGAEVSGRPEGTIMTIAFELDGQEFVALNGGPHFRFTEAISFVVNCESQDEVDYYWEKLSQGGDEGAQQCGWLKDKYGVSWQIAPTVLARRQIVIGVAGNYCPAIFVAIYVIYLDISSGFSRACLNMVLSRPGPIILPGCTGIVILLGLSG